MLTLDLNKEVRADINRYTKMLIMHRSGQALTGELAPGGSLINTKEVERHLENVIRELEALLRDGKVE
jgi:hypothetical protein